MRSLDTYQFEVALYTDQFEEVYICALLINISLR